MTAPTGTWIECDGGFVGVCTAWLGTRMCDDDATHEWRVPGEEWLGIAACPDHLDLALHVVEEDPEPEQSSDAATLAEARRLATNAWTARTIWGRDDERTHRAVHELLGFLLGDGA